MARFKKIQRKYGKRGRRIRTRVPPQRKNDYSIARRGGFGMIPNDCGVFKGIGVPQCLFTKLRYVQRAALQSPTILIPGVKRFRLNSLFDPDESLGGEQYMGFDQISLLYTHYQVFACKITITFSMAPTAEPQYISMRGTVSGASPTDIDAEAERRNARSQVLVAGGQARTMTMYFDNAKLLGLSKTQYQADEDCRALTTGNPNTQTYLNILTLTSGPDTITNIIVKMTAYVKFFNLQDFVPS